MTFSKQCFLQVDLSICVCVCLCVCPFTFEEPFKRLFAPTYRNWMSKIFRDSEYLGKLGKTFTNKGCKITPPKKFVFE